MDTQSYLDVEVRVLPRQESGEHPVELTVAGEATYPRGKLSTPLVPWVSAGDAVVDGQRLFDALLTSEGPRRGWVEARGRSARRRVRLWLDVEVPALHALPWELLRDGDTLLAADADTPFSRYLPVAKPWGANRTPPLRVLAAISAPQDIDALYGLPPVDAAIERTLLEEVFFPLEGETLRMDVLEPPVTLPRLETALQRGYDALHYVGHGIYNARRQQTALYLQDADGGVAPVRDRALLELLDRQDEPPLLISLMACQSAVQGDVDAFLGLGPRLVRAGVPAVVAMRAKVTMKSARTFSAAFYRCLANRGLVDLAANQARSLLISDARPDIAVPALFMRLRSGRLWADPSSDAEVAGVTVQGDVSGQAAASGSGPVTQIGTVSGGEVTLGTTSSPSREALQLEELRELLDGLRERVTVDVAPAQRESTLQALDRLEAAIWRDPPDLATMASVRTWFRANAPRLAGAVTHNVLLHPGLRQRIAAAGAVYLTDYRRRFLDAYVKSTQADFPTPDPPGRF